MPGRLNLVGHVYGFLKVIEFQHVNKHGKSVWLCECECGDKTSVVGSHLRMGETSSCGCKSRELKSKANKTHGMQGTTQYSVWGAMKSRCNNPKDKSWSLYGGRGIKVCDRWNNSFEDFWEDMKEGHAPHLQLDRADNSKGYCRDNCRWVTPKQNSNNRRNNVLIATEWGRMTIAMAAERAGIPEGTIRQRKYVLGWDESKLLLPSRRYRK